MVLSHSLCVKATVYRNAHCLETRELTSFRVKLSCIRYIFAPWPPKSNAKYYQPQFMKQTSPMCSVAASLRMVVDHVHVLKLCDLHHLSKKNINTHHNTSDKIISINR